MLNSSVRSAVLPSHTDVIAKLEQLVKRHGMILQPLTAINKEHISALGSCGADTLEIILDTARQREIAPLQQFVFKEIRLVSNGSQTVKAVAATEKNLTFEFKKGQWYSLELWGDIDNKKDTLLAFTGAMYCV